MRVLLRVRADHGLRMSTVNGEWRVQRLEAAQQDIYRLLAFATEQGRTIEKPVLRRAVDIARIKPEEMGEEQEEALWEIRSTLSEEVQPAHASGLRLMEILEAQTGTGEPRTLRGWSGRWLLIAVLIVAAVHAYSLVGGRLIHDGADKALEAASLKQLIDSQLFDTQMSPGHGNKAATVAVAGAAPPNTGTSQGVLSNVLMTPEDVDGAIEKLSLSLNTQRELLEMWNNIWRLFTTLLPGVRAHASPSSPDATASADTPPPGDGTPRGHIRARFREFVHTVLAPFQAEQYAADVAHETMMEYLLPMLYGALGAFVFVVRLVTNDIDRGSLRMLLRIRYRIRLLLGAIFGLTIAMLTT